MSVAPHSLEAEQGVIGSMLLDPREIPTVVKRLKESDFHNPSNRTIFKSLVAEWEKGGEIDLITFTQALKDRKVLEKVGGAGYVTSLFTFVPASSNVGYYIDIMEEKSSLRSMLAVFSKAIRDAGNQEDPDKILSETQSALLAIGSKDEKDTSIQEFALGAMEQLEKAFENKGAIPGLSTGLIDLDKQIGGMLPSQFIVISGETGEGKTTLAMKLVEENAIVRSIPCGVISLEMSGYELATKFISSISKVDLHTFVVSGGSDEDCSKISDSVTKIVESPIHINDESDIDFHKMRAIARDFKRKFNIQLLVVDYIQLLTPSTTTEENRERAMAGAAAALKQMAKELSIVVIGVSQLNDYGKLRESRAIGHHADKVMKIDRSDIQTYIRVEKNRQGPKGSVAVAFVDKFAQFSNASKFDI